MTRSHRRGVREARALRMLRRGLPVLLGMLWLIEAGLGQWILDEQLAARALAGGGGLHPVMLLVVGGFVLTRLSLLVLGPSLGLIWLVSLLPQFSPDPPGSLGAASSAAAGQAGAGTG